MSDQRPAVSDAERITAALGFAKDGQVDGDHHQAGAIDQMVRALTGCPVVEATATDAYGRPYSYREQGESEEYRQFIAVFCTGEDGPETYDWDCGIAP